MIEANFDIGFTAALALREKQIQQSYRPIIGIHKWFARRPGTLFRSLLLAEFQDRPVANAFWSGHRLEGVIADPFMGGGTPIFEATRLGFSVIGTDINPMAYWIVRQALAPVDLEDLTQTAEEVVADVERTVGEFYRTECTKCGGQADVKYFIWVKVQACPGCGRDIDLFPGYLLAKANRHPGHVVACAACGALNEYDRPPTIDHPSPCQSCGEEVSVQGTATRGSATCRHCETVCSYPDQSSSPPRHRMWAIEYHCGSCKPRFKGRFFKAPDSNDLDRFAAASEMLGSLSSELPIPQDPIPCGDETDRLHRWGYGFYREMFNERQLVGLGFLLKRIAKVHSEQSRHALLTVFSDFLRYQNMLCRYDTYALKCQDIFSIHGFPVGLIQCENNLLGIPFVGSGSFRHFVQKYQKAKQYVEHPFETIRTNGRKSKIITYGERIRSGLVSECPVESGDQKAFLLPVSAEEMPLPKNSLHGVFTDPPYFDNVQYAELMDFCFVWLRLGLGHEIAGFEFKTTRSEGELTGNSTLGRGLEHFTDGLSTIFRHYAAALRPGGPFVFTYHHNDPEAYIPLIVAMLDAGLSCSATLPAPAEMSASLHINGTNSSILDSVFVCRAIPPPQEVDVEAALKREIEELREGGVSVTKGDVRCLAAGHLARSTVNRLRQAWDSAAPLSQRMNLATVCLREVTVEVDLSAVLHMAENNQSGGNGTTVQLEAAF